MGRTMSWYFPPFFSLSLKLINKKILKNNQASSLGKKMPGPPTLPAIEGEMEEHDQLSNL